jgi:topoisomerase-4 subunit B
MASEFNGRGKVDVSRFKGLGEMLPKQLKETTMNRATRTLLRVEIDEEDRTGTTKLVDQLMGNKPEARFKFIQERAAFAEPEELDI